MTIKDFYGHRITTTEAGCWLWDKLDRNGYPLIVVRLGRRIVAHKFAYFLKTGKWSDGFDLDHKCRMRACVNPDHLDLVTHQENITRSPFSRRIACKRGHVFSTENTGYRVGANGRTNRVCKTCSREYREATYQANKEEVKARSKLWQQANADKVKERHAKRRKEKRYEILAYQRAWYAKNGRKKS